MVQLFARLLWAVCSGRGLKLNRKRGRFVRTRFSKLEKVLGREFRSWTRIAVRGRTSKFESCRGTRSPRGRRTSCRLRFDLVPEMRGSVPLWLGHRLFPSHFGACRGKIRPTCVVVGASPKSDRAIAAKGRKSLLSTGNTENTVVSQPRYRSWIRCSVTRKRLAIARHPRLMGF